MINRDEYMRDITRKLSWFSSEVIMRNSLGLHDISVYAETLFCGLMNMIFDLHLVNLNQANHNFPAVDLGDMDERVAVQVTSTLNRAKIYHTLGQFFEHDLDQQFDVMYFVVIRNGKFWFGDEPSCHPELEKRGFKFCPSKHIWDMPRLVEKISTLNDEKIEEIARYLNAEVGSSPMGLEEKKNTTDVSSLASVEDLLHEVMRKLEDIKARDEQNGQVAQEQKQSASRAEQMKAVLRGMEDNLDNSRENDWHKIFNENEWVLAQLFAQPHIKLKDKAYVGGKDLDNQNGNECDFVYQNTTSGNVVLIEIKNPCAPIIGHKYRGTYGLSHELTGAVNQVLNYRDHLIKEYYATACKTEESFQVINPRCVVIIGKMSSMEIDQVAAFENFRNELNSVAIMTFDEVCQKTRHLLTMLS